MSNKIYEKEKWKNIYSYLGAMQLLSVAIVEKCLKNGRGLHAVRIQNEELQVIC